VVLEDGGTVAQVLGGLDWVASRRDVRVVVLCWGFWEDSSGDVQDVLQQSMLGLLQNGILPIVAAGDSGPGKVDSPGNCFGVTTVGAMRPDRTLAPFSSSSRRPFHFLGRPYRVPSLVAPGEKVCSCARGQGYIAYRGTTPAAAIVAGVAALILE